jgi:DNA repair photolyase
MPSVSISSPVVLPDRRVVALVGTGEHARPVTWYVEHQVTTGKWREEVIPAEIVGLSRPLHVFRAPRRTNLIVHAWHGDRETFCPPTWWDLAIGSGACGLGCRACFLILTHRVRRDPCRHLLYDNVDDFQRAVERWLKDPRRGRFHTLGVGIDRSDSLLYEGVTGHVRRLAPLFGSPEYNPNGNRLILLTKTANVGYLEEVAPLHRRNIVVSFSLNPEAIADLWEGKWPDGERITPPIDRRLEAAKAAQEMGYEVRVRLDPILTPEGWEDLYADFVVQVKALGIRFRYWTLGTYREKNPQLDGWRERWGLPPMEWHPDETDLVKEGTHYRLSDEKRMETYTRVIDLIRREFPDARIGVCKETHTLRRKLGLCRACCNCLP